MLTKSNVALSFYVHYTDADGVSVTGLTVTVDVYEHTTEIITGASAVEIGDGLYYYTLAANSVDADAAYIAVFKTDSLYVVQRHLPALWQVGTTLKAVVSVTNDVGIDEAAISADVWAYTARTLTQTAAQVAAVMAGSTLTIQRGDTLTATLTGLGSLATRSKLWFTVKNSTWDSDDAASLFIEETAGLTRLNGATYTTTTDGDITVDDEGDGDITITVKAAATAALSDQRTLVYDVQILRANGTVATLTSGTAIVTADVTRAVT